MSPISKTLQHVLGWSGGENPAILLLESIASCGSINLAAKDFGLSYKAAWEKNENLIPVCFQLGTKCTALKMLRRFEMKVLSTV